MRSSTAPQWVTLAGLMITHILDTVALVASKRRSSQESGHRRRVLDHSVVDFLAESRYSFASQNSQQIALECF